MAKATTIKVKLVSSADTGFYYVTKKNSRTMTDKLDEEEIRSGREEARRVPRSEDQVIDATRASQSAVTTRAPVAAPFLLLRWRCRRRWPL